MPFAVKDRVFETSITNGVGDYALLGAPTGFQPFSVLGANAYTEAYAEDGTNWESFIAQVLTGPARLSRVHILESSNGGAAVNWAGGTTKNIRCGRPASLNVPKRTSKSIAGGAATTVLSQLEQRVDVLEFTGAITGNQVVEVDTTVWKWAAVYNNTTGNFTVTLKVNGQAGIVLPQGKRVAAYCDGADVRHSVGAIAPGAADQKLFTNAGASGTEWATGVALVSGSRDVSITGNQSITGVGFKPSAMIIACGSLNAQPASIGFANSGAYTVYANKDANGAGQIDVTGSYLIQLTQSPSNEADATLVSFDADGFTLNWTKFASPTGTYSFWALCFR